MSGVEQPRSSRAPKPGAVYMIRVLDFVKIGYSKNTHSRVTHLRTANPFDVTLLGETHTDDCERIEAELHRRFEAHHHRGEWYRWVPEMDVLAREWEEATYALVATAIADAFPHRGCSDDS